METHKPYTFLQHLTVANMEDLIGDIQECAELEQDKNVDFWRDMTTIMEYEIAKLLKLEASGEDLGKHQGGQGLGQQLVVEGTTYRSSFRASKERSVLVAPTSRWATGGACLQQLFAHMARARLRESH